MENLQHFRFQRQHKNQQIFAVQIAEFRQIESFSHQIYYKMEVNKKNKQ